MDINAFKVLLESQERSFKAVTDIIVEQLKTKIVETENKLEDVVKSLEFSRDEE